MIGFDLSDEQKETAALFREFSSSEIAPGAGHRDQTGEFPYELLPKLADTGIFSLIFPKEVGGLGGDAVTYVLALEEIARADQSVAATVGNQIGLAALPLCTFGNVAQRDQWLPKLFSGTVLGALGLTEPSSGSDAASISTTARRSGDSWILNGTKMFITNSGTKRTGFVLVAANTGPTADSRLGSSVFIVESGTPGFSVGPNLKKMGWRSSDTHQLFFDECRIPATSLLGEEGNGLRQFLRTLDFGRIQVATLGVGLAQAALDLAVRYATERRAFGQPIVDFQGISFKLADMEVGVRAARLLTLEAAWRRDRGLDFSQEAACAKLFASELAMQAANACLQIHGGYGFMDDSAPSRLFRDAKILEIGEGTSEIQRLLIARKLIRGAASEARTPASVG